MCLAELRIRYVLSWSSVWAHKSHRPERFGVLGVHACSFKVKTLAAEGEENDYYDGCPVDYYDYYDGCPVCFDGPADAGLRPCGHFGFCWPCAEMVADRWWPSGCPVCRSPVTGVFSRGVGIVSASAGSPGANGVDHIYTTSGRYHAKRRADDAALLGDEATYGNGDTVTVRLNLDADTIAFKKNGAAVSFARCLPK